jgi:hypothetical protein
MANLEIFDLHRSEIENEIIAITDSEQSSVKGGSKQLVKLSIAVEKIHRAKGKWYSFL